MPELPDLAVFSSNLEKRLKGKKVREIKVHVGKKLNVPAKDLGKRLKGQQLSKVSRDGKELHLQFDKGDVLAVHLMLHGKLEPLGETAPEHTILELIFEDKTGLALTDWQKAATPTLNPDPPEAPDALSVTEKYLHEKLQSGSMVKNVLLDQHILRGIGNAYADEILWDARISPFSVSRELPGPKVKELVRSIKKVLTDAEKQIKKTNPDIISGEIRGFLAVHHSKKKESPTGARILQKKSGSRKTYYTEEQEYFG